MFVLVDGGRMNMDNVEEFFVVLNGNVHELRVRFVSGTEKVLASGTLEQCYHALGLIMASHAAAQR